MAPILRSQNNGEIKQQFDIKTKANSDSKSTMQSKRKRNRNNKASVPSLSKETRLIDEPPSQKRKRNEIDSTYSRGAQQYNSDGRFDENFRVNIKPLSPGTLRRFGVKVNIGVYVVYKFSFSMFN